MNLRRLVFAIPFMLVLTAAVQAQGAGTYNGTITAEEFYSVIDVPGVTEGATITIDAEAVSGDLDLIVELYVDNGIWAGQSDDREPGNPNPYLVYEHAPAGDYQVLISRYGYEEGNTTGDYVVTIEIKESSDSRLTLVTPEMVVNPEDAGYPATLPAAPAEWTILAYLAADNNLEAGIMYDLDEFERAGGSTDRVRIVALLDRAVDYDTSNGNWTDARLYVPGPDKSNDAMFTYPPTLDSDPIAYLGEIDMAADTTLLNFLVWGIRNYPAEHYAISLNNHGGAWAGTVWDDSAPASGSLTMPEMAAVFQRALQETGKDRFDLLVNDSCLMSSIENFATISPYFDYVFSSPEIMNNPGFDMTLMTELLNRDPNMDVVELGAALADKYMQDMETGMPGIATYLGAAVTDMREFPKLLNALTEFTSYVGAKPESFVTLLGRARANTYTYSTWADSFENVDLGDLMRRIVQSSRDEELTNAARNVINALQQSVVYSTAGDLLTRQTSNFNIFFPSSSSGFNPRYRQQSPLRGWSDLLRVYYGSLASNIGASGFDAPSGAPDVRITNLFPSVTSIHVPVTVSMEVVGTNISHGDFTVDRVLDDGSQQRLSQRRIVTESLQDDGTVEYINFWHPGVDDFDFTWSMQIPFVSDGQNENPERVVMAGLVSSLSGTYTYPDSTSPIDVDIVFDEFGGFSALISRHRNTSGFANIQPQAGGVFQAYSFIVTPDGQAEIQPGNAYIWPENGLSWVDRPAPDGLYDLGFLIQGFSGETGFSATTVQVANDALDPTLQGFVDIEWGYNFTFPADWSPVIYYPEQGWEAATGPTGEQFIYVYPVSPSSSDPQTVAEETMAQYGVEITPGTLKPSTINGQAIVEFSYVWTIDSGITYSGRALAFYQAPLDLGFVVASETTDGSDPTPIYALLRNSIQFFDPVALTERDSGKWTSDAISDLARYPILEDWSPGIDVEGGWRIYYEDGLDTSETYVAISERTASDAGDVLADLMVEYFANDETVQTEPQETYFSEANSWERIRFSYTNANDEIISGAIFVLVDDGIAHIIWAQTTEARLAQVVPSLLVTVDGYTLED